MLDVKAASMGALSQGNNKLTNKAKALNALDKSILTINKTNVQAKLGPANQPRSASSVQASQTAPTLANDGSAIVGINVDTTA